MLSRTICTLLLAAAWLLALPCSVNAQGNPPDIFFDTEIVEFSLTGAAPMPFGLNGADVDTTIVVTRATDHNSSRSNKTSSIAKPSDPDDTDDVDPDDLDGQTLDLIRTIDVGFEMEFTATSGTFDPALGNMPTATTPEGEMFEFDALDSTFEFDKDAPDFGMLNMGAKAVEFRGHVTVLKIAFGGGGGDLELGADAMTISSLVGTDTYSTLPDGRVEHRFGASVAMSGLYKPAGGGSFPFAISGLSGTFVEQGSVFNNVVPEPSSMVMLAAGALLVVGYGRRRIA